MKRLPTDTITADALSLSHITIDTGAIDLDKLRIEHEGTTYRVEDDDGELSLVEL